MSTEDAAPAAGGAGEGPRLRRLVLRAGRDAPETTRVLESIPGLVTAFLSVMLPGTHLPRHRGVTKAIVIRDALYNQEAWDARLRGPELLRGRAGRPA